MFEINYSQLIQYEILEKLVTYIYSDKSCLTAYIPIAQLCTWKNVCPPKWCTFLNDVMSQSEVTTQCNFLPIRWTSTESHCSANTTLRPWKRYARPCTKRGQFRASFHSPLPDGDMRTSQIIFRHQRRHRSTRTITPTTTADRTMVNSSNNKTR